MVSPYAEVPRSALDVWGVFKHPEVESLGFRYLNIYVKREKLTMAYDLDRRRTAGVRDADELNEPVPEFPGHARDPPCERRAMNGVALPHPR